jgi:predicted RNA binding protein YcfA (HicA-like mRNA interferase family)
MTKFPTCSSDVTIAAIKRDGFTPRPKQNSGSHQVFLKPIPGQKTRVCVVPIAKKEIPEGTLLSILRQAGITKAHFIELLAL